MEKSEGANQRLGGAGAPRGTVQSFYSSGAGHATRDVGSGVLARGAPIGGLSFNGSFFGRILWVFEL